MGKAHPTGQWAGGGGPSGRAGNYRRSDSRLVPGARWQRRDDCSEPRQSCRGRQVRGCGGHTGLGPLEAAVRGGVGPTAPGCLLPRGQALPRCLHAGWAPELRREPWGLRGVRAGARCPGCLPFTSRRPDLGMRDVRAAQRTLLGTPPVVDTPPPSPPSLFIHSCIHSFTYSLIH